MLVWYCIDTVRKHINYRHRFFHFNVLSGIRADELASLGHLRFVKEFVNARVAHPVAAGLTAGMTRIEVASHHA